MSPAAEPEAAAQQPEAAAAQQPAEAQPDGAGNAMPETIVIERAGIVPEGIEYDQANGRILVGSLSEGTVFEVGTDGSLTPFVTDDELVSSVGIEADETGGRLLVANSDRDAFGGQSAGQAKLGIYDLATGERTAMIDLAAAIEDAPEDATYFANDVAAGDDGTAYVTDTMMNVVYRVGADGEASVLHRFEDSPGPNGIVHDDAGFLLVVGGGNLYKIPVDDPASASMVEVPEPLEGGDGMVLLPDGRLAVVSNSTSRVIALESGDDWQTAEIAGTAEFEGQGTTAAVIGEDTLYVVRPVFEGQDPPSIVRVSFD